MSGHHHHSENDHHEGKEHGHTHGTIDSSILTADKGIWAVKWSFTGLFITSVLQLIVVFFTGSIGLLADTIHNFADATTAIPLGIAFLLAKKKPTPQFTYGYGKAEDLAGLAIVATIFFSALVAGYESIQRFFHPEAVHNLWAVILASIIGFLGNEIVAIFRIRVGKGMGSAALVADGYHARADGFTSLAVLVGAIGVWLGFPLADPLVGLFITVAVLRVVWDSSKAVLIRLLDGVDPETINEIKHAASHCESVEEVTDIRVRWLGHRMHTELNIAVDPKLSVVEGHEIAKQVRHYLMDHLKYLINVTIHVDPSNAAGEKYHTIEHPKHDAVSHAHH